MKEPVWPFAPRIKFQERPTHPVLPPKPNLVSLTTALEPRSKKDYQTTEKKKTNKKYKTLELKSLVIPQEKTSFLWDQQERPLESNVLEDAVHSIQDQLSGA
jgi:hypothetical protein